MTIGDVPEMFSDYATDVKMTKYLSREPYTDIEKLCEFVEKCVTDYDSIECYHWVITMNDNFIGTINLHNIANRQERCELGYCIASQWWNRGIMTEAVSEVIRFAFEELNANKICAMFDIENIGSGRVTQKNGLTKEGLLREHSMRKDGTRGDLAFYAILRSEWSEKQVKKTE